MEGAWFGESKNSSSPLSWTGVGCAQCNAPTGVQSQQQSVLYRTAGHWSTRTHSTAKPIPSQQIIIPQPALFRATKGAQFMDADK